MEHLVAQLAQVSFWKPWIKPGLTIVAILAASVSISRFSVVRLRSFAERLGMGTTTLLENLTKLAIYGMAALLILANLDISIAPLLTALGVGSLAVALALQDTLSNLFAGIYIILNRQIRPGDYVKLGGGEQGYVVDIGWRATVIRERADNHIIIPNTKISQATVTNYHLPRHEFMVPIPVGVSYACDLNQVESVAIEVARSVQKESPGADAAHEPFLHYQSFGESAIQFTVVLRVREFEDQHQITHEFIKRLHDRFGREGIEIPFPQRVVHMAGKKV